VITGYNTDIEFDGIVYHVQTEDKGVASPIIMSLVYNRGTILASKREPYDDLLNGSLDERALSERLQRQHKLICAAVSAGRIEDLKEMSARNLKSAAAKRSAKKKGAKEAEAAESLLEPPPVREIPAESPEIPATAYTAVPAEPTSHAPLEEVPEPARVVPAPEKTAAEKTEAEIGQAWVDPAAETQVYTDLLANLGLAETVPPIAKPQFDPLPPKPVGAPIEPPIAKPDGLNVITDEPMIVIDAVEAISDLAGTDRPESYKLSVDIIGETRFKGGERKDVYVMVCRGSSRKVVPRAEVMVKVLGSSFRPVICHAVTDDNGLATINLKIPPFQSGRATVIARAISEGEEVEIRQAVGHG